MRVNDVSCNCPEYGGQVRHNTGCPLGGWHPSQTMGTTTRPMPRTEAEAVAAERARIRAAVAGLKKWDKRSVPGGFHVNLAAVLAIIDREDTDA